MSEPKPLSPPTKTVSFWTPAMQERCVEIFGPEDEALRAISSDARALGFPSIAVSAADGQILKMLVAMSGAKHVVEIGTLGGYSTLWLARGLTTGGRVDAFEMDSERAAFAREHLMRAAPTVEFTVHEGPALQNLPRVKGNPDFVFIDADKGNYPQYVAWAMEHVAPGGVVALDNSFAWGGLVDPEALGERASEGTAVTTAMKLLAADSRFASAMIPTNEGLAVGWRRR